MKIEAVKKGDLLISYLAANYEGCDTLVIETESPCSKQEFIALMRELDNMGVLPPKNLRTPGATIIIEMPWSSACKLDQVSQWEHLPGRLPRWQADL